MTVQFNLNLVAEYLVLDGVTLDPVVTESFRQVIADEEASAGLKFERVRSLALAVDNTEILALLETDAPAWV